MIKFTKTNGPMAQLGARLNGIEKVEGSSPSGSTSKHPVPAPGVLFVAEVRSVAFIHRLKNTEATETYRKHRIFSNLRNLWFFLSRSSKPSAQRAGEGVSPAQVPLPSATRLNSPAASPLEGLPRR